MSDFYHVYIQSHTCKTCQLLDVIIVAFSGLTLLCTHYKSSARVLYSTGLSCILIDTPDGSGFDPAGSRHTDASMVMHKYEPAEILQKWC